MLLPSTAADQMSNPPYRPRDFAVLLAVPKLSTAFSALCLHGIEGSRVATWHGCLRSGERGGG